MGKLKTIINKDNVIMQISNEQLEHYLKLGWQIGRGRPAWNKGLTLEDDRVKKYALSQLGKHLSEETKQKLSKINKGKKWTKDAIRKRSASRKGFVPSEEQRKKTSLSLMGHVVLEETRKKLSIKNKGKSHPLSLDSRLKISKHNSSKEFQKHQREVKRKNKSFNSSIPEKRSQKLLKEKYGDLVIFNYSENRYPFECDAYIKSLDLFIEFNYHWTHGKHPFDNNSEEDLHKLEELKQKPQTRINSKGKEVKSFYSKAIEVWTIRDVRKIETAKSNKLNYKMFYSEKEFLDWFEN